MPASNQSMNHQTHALKPAGKQEEQQINPERMQLCQDPYAPARQADLERFAYYVRNYNPSDPRIASKICHTYKVVQMMDLLCQSVSLNERQSYLCFLAALYHDIGRFEQVRRFQTFLDAISLPHARLSAQILEQGNFLDHLEESEAKSVIEAVRVHSDFALPEDFEGFQLEMAKLLRDADKLDIFRVFATEDLQVICSGSLEKAAKETIADPVYQAVMKHRCVAKEDRQSSLDIWATFLGFFFDFNVPASFAIADQQGYWKIPFSLIEFENPETRRRVADMLDEARRYIDTQLGQTCSIRVSDSDPANQLF